MTLALDVRRLSVVFGPDPSGGLARLRAGERRAVLEAEGHTFAVDDVSFAVEAGEFLVVMGLSGSGKSTLVRCLNGLLTPTGGEVHVQGEDVSSLSGDGLRALRRGRVAMVFQHFALFPHRTVVDNAAFGLEVMGVEPAERRRRASEMLERVGLGGQDERLPNELSGGMQQRVGLARALAVDPAIVLMDEALSALDPLIRKDMQQELVELQRELGKTFVFISHDLDEAVALGDRVALLKDGRLVQVGTPEEILTNPETAYVRRFVAGVDASGVRTAASLVGDSPPGEAALPADARRVAAATTLQSLIPLFRDDPASIVVEGENGEPLGVVDLASLLDALARDPDGGPPAS